VERSRRPAATVRTSAAIRKADAIARLIAEGHVKYGAELSKGLQSALKDDGFNLQDFVSLQRLFPEGWLLKRIIITASLFSQD